MIDFTRARAAISDLIFNKTQWLVGLLAALMIIGCAQGYRASAENVPQIITSEFDKSIKIVGLSLFDNPFGGVFKQWFLRSFVDKKTGHFTTQLYVHLVNAKNSYIYDIADDDSANSLQVTEMDHNADSESLGVELDQNVLLKHIDSRYRIRISSRSGEEIILIVSPEQIRSQVGAVTDVLNLQNVNIYQGGPHIGLKVVPVGYLLAAQSKLTSGRGMVVVNVEQGSVAEQAGLRNGDLVLSVDGVEINSFGTLNNALKQSAKKKNVTVVAERQGQKFDAQLVFNAP